MKEFLKILLVASVILVIVALTPQPNSFGSAQILVPNAPQADFETYFPHIQRHFQTSTDLTISAIEVTQATQGLSNHVSLVDGRPSTVRVYARVNEASPLPNVRVALSATRGGSPLPGSPMISAAGNAQPLSADATTLRLDLAKSFNFQLPPDWLSGEVNLEARVDSANTYLESDESNNTSVYNASFLAIPPLKVKIVPIKYYDTYYKKTFELTPQQVTQEANTFKNAMMKIYPVSSIQMQVRSASYNFQGDLGNQNNLSSWNTLLNNIASLKASDGSPPSEVYYGLIPPLDSTGASWWMYGVIGYGFVGPPTYSGPRAAVGLASGYIKAINYTIEGEVTAAHEIGHNLGRLHAPCGNPASVDPNYPYSGGVIGQFGFDPANLKIYAPTAYYDIMGYCDNVWISDYNYLAMMQTQINFGASSSNTSEIQASLSLVGKIDEDGSIQIQPAYIVPGYPAQEPVPGDLVAQFVDADGNVISSQPIPISLAQAEQFSSFFINTTLPLPDRTPAGFRILKEDKPVFVKTFITKDRATPNLTPAQITATTSASGLTLHWNLPGIPSILRYSTDGGLTWLTLDIDNQSGEWHGSLAEFGSENIIFQVIPAWSLEPITLNWSPGDIR